MYDSMMEVYKAVVNMIDEKIEILDEFANENRKWNDRHTFAYCREEFKDLKEEISDKFGIWDD